ncbi:formate--tetrahydrofolate ligase [Bosea sp. BIWAKO-01]|uniref:formate--tetrahydrofolate ligase n=1 Tax=Bosea sp. BIWAKO-01 TaxID=506668 RepID=UPI0008536996|nr:formate--tetrahydrofolate ligase [Bosea sp. BIWAKO-01]GAU83326.1 formate-tetrahydrofolate ligase [Bosea sp. BIWAKO-01]
MPTDIEIARATELTPIASIAERIGIPDEALHPYGKYIAKIDGAAIPDFEERPNGKLILVTAISPTPAGEGKTTTTVGLGDGLSRLGKRTMIALREPSLGPCFGMKGGAAGGGYAQVVPMEQINLHFTGDFHAITSAHNLLAALVDNHIYWGNALDFDARNVALRRVMDMNDRALRQIVSSLGGNGNGYPREDGFDITVASEVMAIFCLARDHADLEARLGRIVVGRSRDKRAITAAELKATGAMSVLLKDALMPNLVQSLEGTPAFVHGGPFANIAHGCNSVIATRAALKLADYVVTEAGFGADLGAEKFFDIKCRKAGLKPAAAVVVATVRALKMHGGAAKDALGQENLKALEAGLSNLTRHVVNIRKFGVPPIVAINNFDSDTHAEHELIRHYCRNHLGVEAVICRHWAEGGAGAEELARKVAALADDDEADFAPLYPDAMPLRDKLQTIAEEIYGAAGISHDAKVGARFAELEAAGHGHLPVCVAKTQYSFSADPTLRGAPSGHIVPVRELRLSAGAGFVVAICGDIMTMPGLPREPAAERIHIDAEGQIEGLF